MKNEKLKMLLGIGIAFLFLATIGFTYAWFSSAIIQNDVKNQVVTTGTLSLRYVDGPEIKMENIRPGQTITKTVYVANTGTLDVSYNLVWQELVNEISNDEMVLESICTRMNGETEVVDGSCDGIESSPIGDNIIKKNVSIEPNIVHKYDITITFKELNANQNYNQNKKFNGVIGIEEYKEPEALKCTYDGELVEGAVYTNGQYTYSYKKEWGMTGPSDYGWVNYNGTADGWGVTLTDKESSNAVTTKLCTTINDKPVVSMKNMFFDSNAATIDLSSFNTSNVTNMNYMFYNSKATALNLSNFNTSNVTDMSAMFENSEALSLDLSSFDTSKVTTMDTMFQQSKAKSLVLTSFDTSNVTNMYAMFASSEALSLDLSSFDMSNVGTTMAMFSNALATTGYAKDQTALDKFNNSNTYIPSTLVFTIK